MKFSLLFHTLRHLRWTQIVYKLRYRLHKAKYKEIAAPQNVRDWRLLVEPIARPKSWDGKTFDFLNITDTFQLWNDMRHGALWAYNLNYMDWLNQQGVTAKAGSEWIERFIGDTPYINIGFDPYPHDSALHQLDKVHLPASWRERMWRKASALLRKQLEEQVLNDGAQYEQSLMYHCILLDRLLDVYNISTSNSRFGQEQKDFSAFLKGKATARRVSTN